jgi:hypothetical protein
MTIELKISKQINQKNDWKDLIVVHKKRNNIEITQTEENSSMQTSNNLDFINNQLK